MGNPVARRKTKSLPPEVVNKWPDVFGDVDVRAIPLEYLHSLRVRFNNGKQWDIAVDVNKNPAKQLEKTLRELFHTYDSSIKSDRIGRGIPGAKCSQRLKDVN